MKWFIQLLLLAGLLMTGIAPAMSAQADNIAYLLQINGVINPATADYFDRGMAKAQQENAQFVLLEMDTPGGLDLSMRDIIKKIIASPIPIITYVAPSGSRAASAGTYILYASHIAAMAPATNLGAATPVQLKPTFTPDTDTGSDKDNKAKSSSDGDAMQHKIMNDAVAYIRGLAKLRGRNQQWAEQAVRQAASLTAKEALKNNVIELIADNQSDLLKQLNGKKVTVLGSDITLHTDGLLLRHYLPDWRTKLLNIITDPNIAYILMMIGIYGLIFEFANPGSVVPGTVGAICLLLALFSFQILPINYAGLALILLGIALMIAEAFQPSFGMLGLGGAVSFMAGSLMLIDTDMPGYGINLGLIAGFTVATVGFFVLALGLVFKARHNPIVSGKEEMIGAECVALENFADQGRVRVHSETWTAQTSTPIEKGQKARVTAMDGLILSIVPGTTTKEHKS